MGSWGKTDMCNLAARQARFLFIAIKPSSADYYGGRFGAKYSSDSEIMNMLTAERLVKSWSTYLLRNMNLDPNETGYEFCVFKNGIHVWGNNQSWDGAEPYGYTGEEYYAHYDELEAQEKADTDEINGLYEQAKARAEAEFGKKP